MEFPEQIKSSHTFAESIQTYSEPPTALPKGHGLLIDTGAIVNLHSDYWRRNYQKSLSNAGLKAKTKEKKASFTGIGGKASVSTRLYDLPINVNGVTGNFISQELDNSTIPAILGLHGIERNEMMIIPHDDRVIIPNGGKVKISVSKEVRIIQCKRTLSGHLLLPCDTFNKKDEDGSSITLLEGSLQ